MVAAVARVIHYFLLLTYTKDAGESFALFFRRGRGWSSRWEGGCAWGWNGLASEHFKLLRVAFGRARKLRAALRYSCHLTVEQTPEAAVRWHLATVDQMFSSSSFMRLLPMMEMDSRSRSLIRLRPISMRPRALRSLRTCVAVSR